MIDFELLGNLMNLYLVLGIFLLILCSIAIGYIIFKVYAFLTTESEKSNKKMAREIYEEYRRLHFNEKK